MRGCLVGKRWLVMGRMDRVVFLGTAGDTETVVKQLRRSGGVIVTLAGFQFHIDPGPGCLNAARAAGVSPRDTIAVLATSNELFQSADVNVAVSAMTYEGIDRHGVLLAAKSVIEGGEGVRLFPRYRRFLEGLMVLVPGTRVGVNDVTVTAVPSRSVDPDAVGLVLSTADLRVGFTGVTGWFEELAASFRDLDELVVWCRHPHGTREEGALNVDAVISLLQAARPKHAFLTGFGSKLLAQDPVSVARSIQRAAKVPVTAAKDGLEASF